MVPHLITSLTGPINELEQRVLESMPATERWFRLEWMEHTPPFYTSVDLRNAGFKLAPVSTNLFPDGFHHLTPEMLPLAVQAAMAAIEKICPEAKNLLLVPRQDSRDTFYLANLQRLVRIFNQAGLNVRLGTLDETIKKPTTVALADGTALVLEPLLRSKRRLGLKNFDPCTVLLNTDLSAGVPKVLEGLHEQYVLPPLHAGGAVRRRAKHAHAYEEVAKKLAKLLGMDPWLITPLFSECSAVNMHAADGLNRLRSSADALLAKVRRKYKDYGIKEKPFVIIKSDGGAHPWPSITLRDAAELAEPGRLGSVLAKGGPAHSDIFIQEGVPTFERINAAVAEPVVTMIDRYVIGGYYRIHAERAADDPLNAPGSSFVPLAFAQSGHLPRPGERPGASAPNRFYMYGVVARLAMLAAAYELEATDPDAEQYD